MEKNITLQIILFTVSVFIASFLFFIRISSNNLELLIKSEFYGELRVLASDLNRDVLISREKVKALSSRSMIRKMLADYTAGRLSLEDLKSYTDEKYNDGASVYTDLVYAFRTDPDGNIIARCGGPGDLENPSGTDAVSFFETEQGYNIKIINEIMFEDKIIGYDTAAFFIIDFRQRQEQLLASLRITKGPESNERFSEYSSSLPVGDTDYYLYAELNQDFYNQSKKDMMKTTLLQVFVMLLLVIIISSFTILRVVIQLIQRLQNSNASLTASIEERELLFHELQHRIKNNLNFILSYIQLQTARTNNTEIIEWNNHLVSKIEALTTAYNMLHDSGECNELHIGAYLIELCDRVAHAGHEEDVKLVYDVNSEITADSRIVVTLGLVFSELIVNSIKHAGLSGTLEISFGVSRCGDALCLYYTDDGRPYPENFDFKNSGSLGLLLITSLVDQLGGRLEFDFSKDKRIDIIIPGK